MWGSFATFFSLWFFSQCGGFFVLMGGGGVFYGLAPHTNSSAGAHAAQHCCMYIIQGFLNAVRISQCIVTLAIFNLATLLTKHIIYSYIMLALSFNFLCYKSHIVYISCGTRHCFNFISHHKRLLMLIHSLTSLTYKIK